MYDRPTQNDARHNGGSGQGENPAYRSDSSAKSQLGVDQPLVYQRGAVGGNGWFKWAILLIIVFVLFKSCQGCENTALSCWFDHLKLNWEQNKLVREQQRLEDLIEKNSLEIKPCTTHSSTGKNEIAIDYYALGDRSGTVTIAYDMAKIPDMMELYYDGEMVATTGDLVSGEGRLSWNYIFTPTKPTYFMIKMVPSQNENTVWSYDLYCPQ
jgi:hypothetical protein